MKGWYKKKKTILSTDFLHHFDLIVGLKSKLVDDEKNKLSVKVNFYEEIPSCLEISVFEPVNWIFRDLFKQFPERIERNKNVP